MTRPKPPSVDPMGTLDILAVIGHDQTAQQPTDDPEGGDDGE